MTQILQSAVTIVLFFLVLGGLVLVHEFGHFVVARLANVRVLEFGVGFPPRARVLSRRGETLYTLNWLPIGGFVKLAGEDGEDADDPRSFSAARLPIKLLILVAGVTMNLLVAFVLFTAVAAAPSQPQIGTTIEVVEPGSPAEAAGLKVGDKIVAINGARYDQFDAGILGNVFVDDLRSHAGGDAQLAVIHADGSSALVVVHLRPLSDTGPGRGALGVTQRLELLDSTFSRDAASAVATGARRTAGAFSLILDGLGQLGEAIVQRPTEPPPAAGPIGIAVQIGDTFWRGTPLLFVMLIAILSANLALVNILPFPPLDGGRIVVVLMKSILGRRISLQAERLTYFLGFVLLMSFLVWITAFDIARQGGVIR